MSIALLDTLDPQSSIRHEGHSSNHHVSLFQVNENYTFSVEVTALGRSSIATFHLMIIPADLRAVISGASLQYWHRNEEIDLDASGSFDPDYPDTQIDFHWICSVVSGDESVQVFFPQVCATFSESILMFCCLGVLRWTDM